MSDLTSPTNHTPTCIGFILDGNRRWAREQGLPTFEGHRAGADILRQTIGWCKQKNIRHLVAYTLSTENLHRSFEEISYFMKLLEDAVDSWMQKIIAEDVRLRVIGDLHKLPPSVREKLVALQAKSIENTGITVWLCLAYGGRLEIVEAARALATAGEEVSEASLRAYLWSAEMPDPDLIVRTGGEQRLSNFLLWQSAYSELFFLPQMWPDFSEALLDHVLTEYAGRERRRGK